MSRGLVAAIGGVTVPGWRAIRDEVLKMAMALPESKHEIEERIRELDLPATVIRPRFIMQNFEGQRDDVLDGTLALPIEEGVFLQMVAPDDIGALVAAAFADPKKYIGKDIDLAGDKHTLGGMAAVFSDVIGNAVETRTIPFDVVREEMGEDLAGMFEWFNDHGNVADIEGLQREHDLGLTSLETYLREYGWDQ